MSRTPNANIKSELLRWARVTRGFSVVVAAKLIGIDELRLRAWEDGTETLTMAQLRKAATVYKRPVAAFFLEIPPAEIERPPDFRRVPGMEAVYSPELLLAIRRATFNREVAVHLANDLGERPPETATAPPGCSAHALAELIRETLGVSLQDQFSAVGEYGPLKLWRGAVERTGVLVFQSVNVAVEEMRGFSLALRPFPVIVLNPQDGTNGRVFTLLHEVAHVLLNGSAVCLPQSQTDGVEQFCNEVAGEALVPRSSLAAHEIVRGNHGAWEWATHQLEGLAKAYGVSEDVILRRLLEAGLTNKAFYNLKRSQYAWRRASGEHNGGPSHDVRVVSSLGIPFVRLVFESLARDVITLGEASAHLGSKVDFFDAIEARAFS